MAYKKKYTPTRNETFSPSEIKKIMDGIDRETQKQEFWKMLVSAFLIAFVIVAIMILMGG